MHRLFEGIQDRPARAELLTRSPTIPPGRGVNDESHMDKPLPGGDMGEVVIHWVRTNAAELDDPRACSARVPLLRCAAAVEITRLVRHSDGSGKRALKLFSRRCVVHGCADAWA
jgi:hypothetical protein